MPTPESRLGEAEVSGKAARSHENEARKQGVGFHVTGSHKFKIVLRRESSQIYFKRESTLDLTTALIVCFYGDISHNRNIFRYILCFGDTYFFSLTTLKSLMLK